MPPFVAFGLTLLEALAALLLLRFVWRALVRAMPKRQAGVGGAGAA
jgi:hypothetical protein